MTGAQQGLRGVVAEQSGGGFLVSQAKYDPALERLRALPGMDSLGIIATLERLETGLQLRSASTARCRRDRAGRVAPRGRRRRVLRPAEAATVSMLGHSSPR